MVREMVRFEVARLGRGLFGQSGRPSSSLSKIFDEGSDEVHRYPAKAVNRLIEFEKLCCFPANHIYNPILMVRTWELPPEPARSGAAVPQASRARFWGVSARF